MLYVLHGTDTAQSRKKLTALIDGLLAKRPDAPLVRIDGDSYDSGYLEAQVGGMGLFAPRSIVVLDSILANVSARDHFCALVPAVADSENVFVCVDGEVDQKTLALFELHAKKVEEHTLEKEVKKDASLIFAFTDAFGERRRADAWVLFERARRLGYAAEELHHKAFWQIKNMLLARSARTPEEVGMKAFPFGKAKRASEKWSIDELSGMADRLVSLNHDSRRGITDLALSFERLLLSI